MIDIGSKKKGPALKSDVTWYFNTHYFKKKKKIIEFHHFLSILSNVYLKNH